MFVFDTDHLSLIERGGSAALSLEMRLGSMETNQLATSIVSYEEQMRGWLSIAAQANTSSKMIEAYDRLERHIDTFKKIRLLPFNEEAALQYDYLRTVCSRVASMDLRIAAVTIAHDATLLTRNLSDFKRVPGLKFEDWSK